MLINMKKILYFIIIFIFINTFTACSDFLDPDTDSSLKEEDYIGDRGELNAGYMGLAACVMEVADQASFLEGLRGDMLEPTLSAPAEMWNVYNYSDVKNNSFVDPKGYYKIIMNANDYIEHAFEFLAKHPTENTDDNRVNKGIIAGAIRYKVWAYLMLARIYGEAVYFDEPITSYGDISKYPLLSYDRIMEECQNLMEVGVNGVNGIDVIDPKTGLRGVRWSETLFPGQSANPERIGWNKICPPHECLLAEIYVNLGEFQKAKDVCLEFFSYFGSGDTQGGEQSYTLNAANYNGEWKAMGYTYTRQEHIVYFPYSYEKKQTNRYVDYYSNVYPSKYYLKPTEVAMNRFKRQYNKGGILNDKYRGEGVTYAQVSGDWVMSKFLGEHTSTSTAYKNDVMIALYRAPEMHLYLVEALVGLGQFNQALPVLNHGVAPYYLNGSFTSPFIGYPSCLYVITGKEKEGANLGVRGRVDLQAIGTDALTASTAMDTLRYMCKLDSIIAEEYCMEFAGEGKSYYAMNRIARRWSNESSKGWASQWVNKAIADGENPSELWAQNPMRDMLASKVASKYTNGRGPAIQGELSSRADAWFIKFDLNYKDQDLGDEEE